MLVPLLAACGRTQGPALLFPGDQGAVGISQYDWEAGQPFVLAREFVVCLDTPGSVRITGVGMRHADNGLTVERFALEPHGELPDYDAEDGQAATLEEFGYDPADTVVTSVCPQDLNTLEPDRYHPEHFTHLGAQLSKPVAGTARGRGLVVTYESGGEQRTLEYDLEVILCGAQDSPSSGQPSPNCDLGTAYTSTGP
jgi:hypothetical protein